MDVGTEVWVKSETHVWEPGVVLDCQAVGATGVVKVRLEASGAVITSVYAHEDAAENELYIRNKERSVDAMACLTGLEHLHEPALLHALSERFAHDEIYTSIGDILVAVNPLKPLDLYAQATIDRYKDAMYRDGDAAADRTRSSSTSAAVLGTDTTSASSALAAAEPHVFAIGAKAFGGLLKPAQRNQSILVSGESGSGKTETTKFLMQFLTSVGRDASACALAAGEVVEIGRRILQTNPILESFGNAQTIRNDNSSRFGKFIKIQFGQRNEIVGAEIASYLLEKVRLIHQSPGERNFHIFYELLEGADAAQLTALGLARGTKYELLNAYGGPMNRRAALGANQFAKRFAQTVQAFDDTGVDRDEQDLILRVLAALLHLGNVNFMTEVHEGKGESGTRDEAAAVTTATRHHFDKCAELLGVTTEDLASLLLTRRITAGSEVMVLKQSAEQAKDICRSLAKAIYGRMFSWLVRRLSDGINYISDSAADAYDYDAPEIKTIGILDIFGFESLDRNGFEQLCINYANERLQAQFNEFVFIKEQDVYVSEGIDWRSIPYPSNDACLALFDDKANGLFSLLDQECLMPKGSDDALGTKFYRYHGGSSTDAAATAGNSSVTGGSLLKHQQSLPAYTLPQLMTSFGRYLHPSTGEQQIEKEPEPGLSKAKPFSASKMDRVKHQFVVNHFAGKVCYRIEQFVEKNLDMLPADASTVFHASTNALVSAIGDVEVLDQVTTDRAPGRRRPSLLRAPSVSAQFKSQLDRLVEEIGWTEAHYIRCLKPNELKRPGIFDRARMVEQLRSVGVLEALRIARAGYSVRLNHASFIELFDSSFRSLVRSSSALSTRRAPRAYCEALVTALVTEMHRRHGTDDPMKRSAMSSLLDTVADDSVDATEAVKRSGAQVGRTLVFCKNETFKTFSRLRLERRDAAATVLQRYYRGYRRRRRFQQLREFVYRIQSIVRGFIARKQVRELRKARRLHAASAIQRCWRKKLAYDHMVERQRRHRRLRAACAIQRCWRSKLARNCVVERKIERFRLRMAFRLVQLAVARLREYVSEPEDVEGGDDDETVPAPEPEAPDAVVVVPDAELMEVMVPEIPVTIVPPAFVDEAPTVADVAKQSTASADERSDSDEQETTHAKHKASSKSSKSKAKAKLKAKKLKAALSSSGRRDKHRSKHGTASTSDASSLSSSSSSEDDAPRKKKSSGGRREKHRGRRVEASESESSSSSDDEHARRRKKSPSSRSSKHRRSHRAEASASDASSSQSSSSSASLSSSDSGRRKKKKSSSSSRHRRHRSHSRRSTASKSAKKKRKDALADEARNLKLETEILRLKHMLLEKHSSNSSLHGSVRPSKRSSGLSSASMARTSRDAARFGIDDLYPDPLDIQARAGRRSLSLDEIDFSADEAEDGDEVSGLLPPRRTQSVYHTRQLDHVSMLSQKIEELDAKCKFLEQLVARKSFDESSRSSVAYSFRSSGSGGWDRRRYPSVIDTSSYAESQLSDRDHNSSGEMDGMIRNIQQQMDMLRQTMATKEEALVHRHATSVSSSRRTRSSSMASTGSLSGLLNSDAIATHQHPHHHHSHHSYAHNALLSPSESHRKQPSSAGSGYSAGSHGFPPTPTSSLLPGPPHSGGPTRMGSMSSVSGASVSGVGGGGRHVPRIVKWARSNQCFECEEPFNIFVRRHHCRMCGNSFCHEHSSRRVTLSGIGFDDEPVRVCDPCFADHCTYAQGPYASSVSQPYSGFPSYGNGSSLSALASSHTSAA